MLGKWTPFDVTPFIEHEKTQDVRTFEILTILFLLNAWVTHFFKYIKQTRQRAGGTPYVK